jgi:hypothetical protein
MIDSSKGDDRSHVPAGLLKFSHHIFFWRGEGAFGIPWVPFSDHRVLILIENEGVKSSLHSAFNGLVMKGQRIEMQRTAGKKFIDRMRLVTCIAIRSVGVLSTDTISMIRAHVEHAMKIRTKKSLDMDMAIFLKDIINICQGVAKSSS